MEMSRIVPKISSKFLLNFHKSFFNLEENLENRVTMKTMSISFRSKSICQINKFDSIVSIHKRNFHKMAEETERFR